jgi:hypothetical protein
MAAASKPVILSSSIPIKVYSDHYATWIVGYIGVDNIIKGDSNKLVIRHDVPALYIYDPSGNLIYYGANNVENAKVLAELPQLPPRMEIPLDLLTRDGLFELVPDFAKAKNAIKGNSLYLVYSLVTSVDMKKDGVQPAATQALRKRASEAHINILELSLLVK